MLDLGLGLEALALTTS